MYIIGVLKWNSKIPYHFTSASLCMPICKLCNTWHMFLWLCGLSCGEIALVYQYLYGIMWNWNGMAKL